MRRMLAVFRTVRGRLVLLVFCATLPALLLALYLASTERTAVLQRIQKEATLLAQLASREHAHQMEAAKSLLHRLALALGDEPGPPGSPASTGSCRWRPTGTARCSASTASPASS